MFNGFQTASGRNVHVSDKALQLAKKLFESIETDPVQVPEHGDDEGCLKTPTVSTSNTSVANNQMESVAKSGRTSPLSNEPLPDSTSDFSKSTCIITTPGIKHSGLYPSTSTPATGFIPPPKSGHSGHGSNRKKLFDELADDIEDETVIGPAEKKVKLEDCSKENENDETKFQKNDSQNESFQQELLESTFALLADEQEDDGTLNSIFGYSNPIPLKNVSQTGGNIPLIHAIILRIYPITYMCKNEQGKNVFESDKTFKKHQQRREGIRQSKLEKLYAEAKREVEASELDAQTSVATVNTTLSKEFLEEMPPDELLRLVQSLGEDSFVLDLLSDAKLQQLKDAKFNERESVRLKIQTAFESKLSSLEETFPTPLLKVRIMDANDNFQNAVPQNVLLSIWRPMEDFALQECRAYQICSLTPAAKASSLHLNSTRTTMLQPKESSGQTKIQLERLRRKYSPLSHVLDPNFSPVFEEFDTVGIIVQMTEHGSNSGTTIYIADPELNVIGVRLWSSVSEQGLEQEVQLMNFIVLQNLQWRKSSRSSVIPCAFSQETTIFALNTYEIALLAALTSFRSDVKDMQRFMEVCQRKISETLNAQTSPKAVNGNQNKRRILVASPEIPRPRKH